METRNLHELYNVLLIEVPMIELYYGTHKRHLVLLKKNWIWEDWTTDTLLKLSTKLMENKENILEFELLEDGKLLVLVSSLGGRDRLHLQNKLIRIGLSYCEILPYPKKFKTPIRKDYPTHTRKDSDSVNGEKESTWEVVVKKETNETNETSN